jgi:hypothetical protein
LGFRLTPLGLYIFLPAQYNDYRSNSADPGFGWGDGMSHNYLLIICSLSGNNARKCRCGCIEFIMGFRPTLDGSETDHRCAQGVHRCRSRPSGIFYVGSILCVELIEDTHYRSNQSYVNTLLNQPQKQKISYTLAYPSSLHHPLRIKS